MPLCQDPALTYLNDRGYNVVRLPRGGIEPLDVLGRDRRSIERLGRLATIWTSTSSAPSTKPVSAAGLAGQKTREIKLSIGLKILEGVLAGLGASVPQLNFAYTGANKVQFQFDNVRAVGVEPFEVGQFLASGDLASGNPFVDRYFQEDDADAFVITEVLESDSITVTATRSDNAAVEVDVPAIQQAVGAKVGVSAASSCASAVTYKGQQAITFGFKCFAVAYVDGDWAVRGVAPSGDLAFGTPQSGNELPVVLQPGGRIVFR